MTAPTTYIRRKAYGDKSWSAKTRESFDINGTLAQLELSTFKDDLGHLVTFASVGFITDPGIVTTAIFGDFFKRLEVTKTRCTQSPPSCWCARPPTTLCTWRSWTTGV